MKKVLVVGAPPLTFAKQVYKGFKKCGIQTKYFNYRMLQLQRTKTTNKLLNKLLILKIKITKPDLVLIIKGESILPGTINQINQTGAKTALWIMDEPFGIYDPKTKIQNLQEYDCIFSFDKSYLKPILTAGAKRALFLPLAVDADYFKEQIPSDKRIYEADVSFIGTHYPNREKALLEIAKATDKIKIWGPYWNENLSPDNPLRKYLQKEKLSGKEAAKHFNLSKINLNTYHEQAKDGGLNLRVYEVLATNSFILTEHLKSIEEQFVIEKEIAVFKTPTDARKAVETYLENDARRFKMQQAGMARILKEHTTQQRAQKIIKEMGI